MALASDAGGNILKNFPRESTDEIYIVYFKRYRPIEANLDEKILSVSSNHESVLMVSSRSLAHCRHRY